MSLSSSSGFPDWWSKDISKDRLAEAKKHWTNYDDFKKSKMFNALRTYDDKPSSSQFVLVPNQQWETMHGSGVLQILEELKQTELVKKYGNDCMKNVSVKEIAAITLDVQLLVDFMVKCMYTGQDSAPGGRRYKPWYRTYQQYAGGTTTGGTATGGKRAGRKVIGAEVTGGRIEGGTAFANLALDKLQVVHHWARFVEVKAALLHGAKIEDKKLAALEARRAKLAADAVGWAQALQRWCNDAKNRKYTVLEPAKKDDDETPGVPPGTKRVRFEDATLIESGSVSESTESSRSRESRTAASKYMMSGALGWLEPEEAGPSNS